MTILFLLKVTIIEDMQAVVLEAMPKAMKLLVPLEIALKSGPTWGDMG